jgi:hypothetical protein
LESSHTKTRVLFSRSFSTCRLIYSKKIDPFGKLQEGYPEAYLAYTDKSGNSHQIYLGNFRDHQLGLIHFPIDID